MSRIVARMRVSIACAALAASMAACGAPEPNDAAPDAGTDLMQALPTSASVPPPTPSPVPVPSAAPATTRSRPAPARAPSTKAAAGPKWRQVGGDDFDGGSLDGGSWNTYDSEGAFGTGYRKSEAVSVSDGLLRITATDDVSGGMRHEMGQLHGRWEFRVRTGPGRGFGSAILLWPDSERFPEDGEIDIMEVPGENRDLAHFVVHWGEDNNVHGGKVPGDYTKWHTFAVEWLPDRLTWYVDGVKQYENTDKAVIPTTPMHLAIQLDQGPFENWIPARDETTPEEIALEVDWVKVMAL